MSTVMVNSVIQINAIVISDVLTIGEDIGKLPIGQDAKDKLQARVSVGVREWFRHEAWDDRPAYLLRLSSEIDGLARQDDGVWGDLAFSIRRLIHDLGDRPVPSEASKSC